MPQRAHAPDVPALDPSKTPDQERADLIDGFAGVFLQETRDAFLASGATDLDGALAPYIKAAVEYQVAIFALGLKELDQIQPHCPRARLP